MQLCVNTFYQMSFETFQHHAHTYLTKGVETPTLQVVFLHLSSIHVLKVISTTIGNI
eukprot:m.389382 g.389382  ORF g.389382 m.389382 type:complete len:57 (-) comp177933_c0_seq1:157-327(-)